MRGLILFALWLLLIMQPSPQTFTCTTAASHVHNNIREGQIVITSWSGCSLTGTVAGTLVKLWADSSICPLRDKVPGTFQIRYDVTCGQVLDLGTGSLPPYCPPSPSPVPTPTPLTTPTPLPSPTPTVGFRTFGFVYLEGTTKPLSGVWVDITDSGGKLLQRVGDDVFSGTGPTGAFDFGLRVPAGATLSAFSTKHPGVTFSTGAVTHDGPYIIFAHVATPTLLDVRPNSVTLRLGGCSQFSVFDQNGQSVDQSRLGWVSNQPTRVTVSAGRACYIQSGNGKSTTIYAVMGSLQSDRAKITFR